MLEKVTIFTTHNRDGRRDLLLFRHPYAGIQLPAGTVELGETAERAAYRETVEETGLTGVTLSTYLGSEAWQPPPGNRPLIAPAIVYARPDKTSFGWATLPRGSTVNVHRRHSSYTHVSYVEWDDTTSPQYITYQLTGWVEEDSLGSLVLRHFFHMQTAAQTPDQWVVHTDNHAFTLFWAPLDELPELEPFQQEWLRHFPG